MTVIIPSRPGQPVIVETQEGAAIAVSQGRPGVAGTDGTDGVGVPVGGTTGQVLSKVDGTDYNTAWATVSGGGATNLGYVAATRTVTSDTGTDAVITLADGSNPGLLASADFTKLAALSGTNTGDQVSIVGITGTIAEFNTALTGADFATGGGTATGTNTGDETAAGILAKLITVDGAGSGLDADLLDGQSSAAFAAASHTHTASQVTDFNTAADARVVAGITGKQDLDADLTTIAGLTATTDNFMQAKAGAWASRTVAQVKTDLALTGTNSGDQTITLTGMVTGSGTGSFTASLGSFTKAQLDTAVSDGNVLYVGDVTTNATHTGDVTGSGALTIAPSAISGKTLVTAVGADNLLIWDATDSTLKRALASDLMGAGGATNLTYTAATRVIASDTGTDATLPLMSSGDAGLVPASGGGTANFLRADGAFAAPAGSSYVSPLWSQLA